MDSRGNDIHDPFTRGHTEDLSGKQGMPKTCLEKRVGAKSEIIIMKKIGLLLGLCLGVSAAAFSQEVKFSKRDQADIQKVLGKDFTAVLGKDGQLAVVTPNKVADLKSTARGGFSGQPGAAANATFAAYEKAWIYKQSGKILESKLGRERFNQLKAIMTAKGLQM